MIQKAAAFDSIVVPNYFENRQLVFEDAPLFWEELGWRRKKVTVEKSPLNTVKMGSETVPIMCLN